MNEIIANPQQIQNVADCIKATNNFWTTIYINICDGTIRNVPNGFWDLLFGGIVFLIGTSILVVIITFIIKFIKEVILNK